MRIRVQTSAVAAAVVALLALAPAASATTYVVSNTTDAVAVDPAVGCATVGGFCTLRSAVQASNAQGGTNTITLAAGTYTLTIAPSGGDDDSSGDLNIEDDQSLTITGAGASTTTIDANFLDRAFNVEAGTSLKLDGVTVENGRPGGLGNVTTCPSSPGSTADGGAILEQGNLTLTNDVITGNMTTGTGGGVSDEGSNTVALSVTGTTISNNQTCGNYTVFDDGAGIFESANTGSMVTIDSSTISGNATAPNGNGGGLAEEGGNTMTVTNSTISGNSASSGGGVLGEASEGTGTINLTADTLSANSAIPFSMPVRGEAPFMPEATGGAIQMGGDNFNIVNSTITGNTATDGGGISGGSGTANISFSTIDANTASGSTDGSGAGNLQNQDSAVYALDDSILAGGVSPTGDPTNCNGPNGFNSNGHNVFDDSGVGCNAIASDLVNASPGLSSLANHGGPTDTQAISLQSPALNAADSTNCTMETAGVDQRGITRPQGPGCDIGAFELKYADLGVKAAANPSTINVGQTTTITDTLTNAGPSTGQGVVFREPAPAGATIESAAASQGSCANTSSSVSCELCTQAVGATITITIVLRGDSPGTVTLNSTVAGTLPDPNLSNNSASVQVAVQAVVISQAADLAVTQTVLPSAVTIGDLVTITLEVTNHGPNPATGVVLTDTLPHGLKLVSTSTTSRDKLRDARRLLRAGKPRAALKVLQSLKPHGSHGTCSGHAKLTCHLGTLANGHHIDTVLLARTSRNGKLKNAAHVTGTVFDPNLNNNIAHAAVIVETLPSCSQYLIFQTNFDNEPGMGERVGTVKVFVDGRHTQTFHGFNLRRVKIKPVSRSGQHSVTVWFMFVSPPLVVTATRTYTGCVSSPTTYAYPPMTGPGAS